MEESRVLITVIQVAPAVLTPLVLWYLNKVGSKTELHLINKYLKRLELFEKLVDFDSKINNKNSRVENTIYDDEIDEILTFLRHRVSSEEEAKIRNFDNYSKIKKWFLWYKVASTKVGILKFFFYYILLGVLSSPFVLMQSETYPHDLFVISIIIYIILLVIISHYANKFQRKALKKSEPNST